MIIGLVSSPLFVAIAAGLAMDWYRTHFEAPPPPPPPSLPRVAIVGKFTPSTGQFRKTVMGIQVGGDYNGGLVDLKLTNQGDKPSNDLYLMANFSDDISVDGLTGFWAIEYKNHDGNFQPIDKKQNWQSEDHVVAVHIQQLNPGIEESMQIVFYYDSTKTPKPPDITCWDNTPSNYTATWEKP